MILVTIKNYVIILIDVVNDTEMSPSELCCKLRGVPGKCMHACNSKTTKKGAVASRGAPLCMNYMDVIENCIDGKK